MDFCRKAQPKNAESNVPAKLESLFRLSEVRIGTRYDENGIRLKDALDIIEKMRDDFFSRKQTNAINTWVAEWFVDWLGAKPRCES